MKLLGIGLNGAGLARQGAGFPHAYELQVQLLLVAGAGVHHPEVGLGQVEVPPHQGQDPPQDHRLNRGAVGGFDHPPGELLGIAGPIGPSDHTDGPVLHRFGDRRNRMVTHRR